MELQITAVNNGTVIDHIPSEKTMKIVDLLGLTASNDRVTVAFNIDSKRNGKTRRKSGIILYTDFCKRGIAKWRNPGIHAGICVTVYR